MTLLTQAVGSTEQKLLMAATLFGVLAIAVIGIAAWRWWYRPRSLRPRARGEYPITTIIRSDLRA